jgi:hypothetical protein
LKQPWSEFLSTPKLTNATDLQRLLDNGADDYAVVDCFTRLLQSWNLDAAAAGFIGAAARVCHNRPRLASAVLQIPIDCLMQIGIASAEDFLRWVQFQLDRESSPMIEDAGPEGLCWLQTELPKHMELLQQLIAAAKHRFPAD